MSDTKFKGPGEWYSQAKKAEAEPEKPDKKTVVRIKR